VEIPHRVLAARPRASRRGSLDPLPKSLPDFRHGLLVRDVERRWLSLSQVTTCLRRAWRRCMWIGPRTFAPTGSGRPWMPDGLASDPAAPTERAHHPGVPGTTHDLLEPRASHGDASRRWPQRVSITHRQLACQSDDGTPVRGTTVSMEAARPGRRCCHLVVFVMRGIKARQPILLGDA